MSCWRFLQFMEKKWEKLLFYIVNGTLVLLTSYFVFALGLARLHLFNFFPAFLFFFFGYVLTFFCFKIFRLVPIKSEKSVHSTKLVFLKFGCFFYFLTLILLLGKKWAFSRFPMDRTEMVYINVMTLTGKFESKILVEVGTFMVISVISSLLFFLSVFFYEKRCSVLSFKSRFIKKINVNIVYFIFSLLLFVFALWNFGKELNIRAYMQLIKRYNTKPIDSAFYKNEYYKPELENISFPDKKKNLIIIFLESMESSFAGIENGGCFQKSLIPNLTKIARENINFSQQDGLGGGYDLSGTGWTVAAMLSKLGGVPFNVMGANIKQNCFLPSLTILTDILAENNYKQVFLFGSDKRFAGRNVLLETHGNVEVHDSNWYKNVGKLPKEYSVFWGFEDKKLYRFAKEELEILSKQKQPFMLGFLTVDTHMPKGYRCESCPNTEDMQLKNAILCADTQIADFINWSKDQDWFKDTVIVIFGDHCFMDTKETSPFKNILYPEKLNEARRWINIVINAEPLQAKNFQEKNRFVSSFDMFPTILAAMACKIKEDRLGFGVNLFSDKKTLCERFSKEYINEELMKVNYQYLDFCKTKE